MTALYDYMSKSLHSVTFVCRSGAHLPSMWQAISDRRRWSVRQTRTLPLPLGQVLQEERYHDINHTSPTVTRCIRHDCARVSVSKGVFENKWTCCDGDLSVKSCHVNNAHVHEQNKLDDVTGYTTLPAPSSTRAPAAEDGNYGVFSLDCEMVHQLLYLDF